MKRHLLVPTQLHFLTTKRTSLSFLVWHLGTNGPLDPPESGKASPDRLFACAYTAAVKVGLLLHHHMPHCSTYRHLVSLHVSVINRLQTAENTFCQRNHPLRKWNVASEQTNPSLTQNSRILKKFIFQSLWTSPRRSGKFSAVKLLILRWGQSGANTQETDTND